MIVKKVSSTSFPEFTQLLQGVMLVNILVEKIEDSFNYTQLVCDKECDPDEMVLKYLAGNAQNELDQTDYYFTVDKYNQLDEDKKLELEAQRERARVTIRTYENYIA